MPEVKSYRKKMSNEEAMALIKNKQPTNLFVSKSVQNC